MAIYEREDGKIISRLQLPTSERTAKGRIKRIDIEKTFPTRGAAEAWEKLLRSQWKRTGTGQQMLD